MANQDHDVAARTESTVRQLRALTVAQLAEAKGAMAAIERHNTGFIEGKRQEKRASINTTLNLLPVAKNLLLMPDAMQADTDMVIDPEQLPPKFDWFCARTKRSLKRWEAESFASLGYFDNYVWLSLDNIRGHLAKAQELKISLDDPLHAYTDSLSQYWSMGKYPASCFRAELDLEHLQCPYATPAMGVLDQAFTEFDSKESRIRTDEEWWYLGLLLLFTLDPKFDGTSVGCSTPIAWRVDADEEGMFQNRSLIRMWVSMRIGRDRIDHVLLNLLERTVGALSNALPSRQIPPCAAVVVDSIEVEVIDARLTEQETLPAWARLACKSLPLRGWHAIFCAIGKRNTRAHKRILLQANDHFRGPIIYEGTKPIVFEERLKCWIESLSENHEFRQQERQSRKGAMDEMQERGGQRLKDLGMHQELRPNATGKARPASAEDE